MRTTKILKTLLIAVMGLGLFACSSDDEPQTPVKYVSAADFAAKVKGRVWVFDNMKTVMSDGSVYDKTVLHYMVGDVGHINAFAVGDEDVSTFWHPTLVSAGWHYNSRTVYSYTYDDRTGHLDMNGGRWGTRLLTLLSVSEDEIVFADYYGITPKDFNPELYDNPGPDKNNELDPDSYIQFTYRLATDEEAAEYWKEYQVNE